MEERYPRWKLFPPNTNVPLRVHYMEDNARSHGCVEQVPDKDFSYPQFVAKSTVVLNVPRTPVTDLATGMALVEVWTSQYLAAEAAKTAAGRPPARQRKEKRV